MDNNNQICNPKTEIPTGKIFNDKDYMNALLNSLKELVKNYSVAMTEASNENLYNNFKEMFNSYSLLQRKAYELMFRNGWYSLEKAEIQKISSKIQMLQQEVSDLG